MAMIILNTNLVIKITISLGIILFCKMIGGSFAYILINSILENGEFEKEIKQN